jgi:putative addiction module component (TIGR02574 family)
MSAEFSDVFKLGRAERIQLVEDLWDSIAREQFVDSVSDAKRIELRRRKERFLKHPQSGLSWEQVKANARSTND